MFTDIPDSERNTWLDKVRKQPPATGELPPIGTTQAYKALQKGELLHAAYANTLHDITSSLSGLPEQERKSIIRHIRLLGKESKNITEDEAGILKKNLADSISDPALRQKFDELLNDLTGITRSAVSVQAHLHPVVRSEYDKSLLKQHALGKVAEALTEGKILPRVAEAAVRSVKM